MCNDELGEEFSGKGDLNEESIHILQHAIGLFEGTELEKYPPYERRVASFQLKEGLPALYNPNNSEKCELFRHGCEVILNAFPKEEDLQIKVNMFKTLVDSISEEVIENDLDTYKEVYNFFIQLKDDKEFGEVALNASASLYLLGLGVNYSRSKGIA